MRAALAVLVAMALLGCGPRPRPDGGTPDEDAGTDAGAPDAGREKGQDPPTGYSYALPIPAGTSAAARFGVSASAVLDQFNQPMLAAINVDPNGDGVFQDNVLVFTRWNGVSRAFEPQRSVEVVGEIDVSHPNRQVSLARDPETGRIGVAYVKTGGAIRLAISDDEGSNWTLETATAASSIGHTLSNPQLAMKAGKVWLAYFDSAGGATSAPGIVVRTRTGTAVFTDSAAPLPSSYDGVAPGPLALALDSAAAPGLAYFTRRAADATVGLFFWRPAQSGATAWAIADSANTSNDGGTPRQPSVSLAFSNDLPRVAYHLATTDPDAQLWYAASSASDGSAFSTRVAMPRNGSPGMLEGTQWYQAIALDGTKVAIASNFATGPAPQICGGPKLSRSNDGATFTTCAPDNQRLFSRSGEFPSLMHHAPGKLTLLFNYESRANPSLPGGGVVHWREP